MFERFYRAGPSRSRDAGGSSGLGLAIVEAIVTAHGGTAGVTSAPGQGATVRVTFPATALPDEPDGFWWTSIARSRALSGIAF